MAISDINENYPVEGVDQPSQGFRDNFGHIKTELTNLQNTKQDTLVSGTNIKTINGASVLGSGDLVVDGSTISDFAATVRATALTGLSTATNAAITATDTVLGAFGKLQAQVTARASLAVANVFSARNRFTQTTCPFTTITWASSIAPDLSAGQAFVVTATGATTLVAPTNADGSNFQSFQLEFIQNGVGSNTLGFNTAAYEASGATFPTVTATANAKTVLYFNRQSNGKYAVSALLDVRSS